MLPSNLNLNIGKAKGYNNKILVRNIHMKIGSSRNINKDHINLLVTPPDEQKKNFIAPFYGWGSTASRLEPLRRGSLLFIIKFPEIPGTHFIDLGRMKG